jgi:hypothetical protein
MTERFQPHARARRLAAIAIPVGLALVIAACDSDASGPEGEGRIQVMLTDFPLEAIASAEVTISRVYLTGGGEGHVDLFNDAENPHVFDVLDLQSGVTLDLTGEVDIPEGSYGQLRFVVDDAHLTLEDGYAFAGGAAEMDLTVPSGFFRVLLHGEIDEEDESGTILIEEGETTVVLVDFDVAASFVFQGPPDAPTGVHFKPVLKQILD